MHIKLGDDIKSSEITDEKVYLNRRKFIRAATLAGTVGASGLLYRRLNPVSYKGAKPKTVTETTAEAGAGYRTPTGEVANSFEDITTYNNFYEFDTSKNGVVTAAQGFITRPWTVEVGGLAHRPRTFDLDDLLKLAPLEERVYRFRCVEAWSMVIPWLGLPLAPVLAAVEPMGNAKYVKFVTLLDKKQMPNQRTDILDWPYQEGLRLDEAMHPLTLLASGLYGKSLPPQNGAPLRLVVPWKYGFKSIKSIVKIELTDEQPATTWNLANKEEYGFYSNVNPNVDHPRWSQASERRIGQWGRIETLMFNGYADQVASMYSGRDLRKEF